MPRPVLVAILAFVACANASPTVRAADLPPAVATDVVREKIVAPLREIGRVHARSALCSAFTLGAADAAESALASKRTFETSSPPSRPAARSCENSNRSR